MDDSQSNDIYESDSEGSVPASIIPRAVKNAANSSNIDVEDHSTSSMAEASNEIQFIHMSSEPIHTHSVVTEQKPSKRKRQESPSESLEKSTNSSRNSKKRARAADNNVDEEEVEKPPKRVTAYIHVAAPASLPPSNARGKKVAPKPTAVKGPFFFSTVDSFESFKTTVAKALPCKPKLLPIAKMEWAYEKPKNSSRKPISTEDGFEAMILSLEERKRDLVVVLSMPPPKADDVMWDDGMGDHIENPFDYEEETRVEAAEDLSVKAQVSRVLQNSDSHLMALQEKYPVGNCEHFPHQRVLKRTLGGKVMYWELTLLRLQIWANSLAMNKPGVSLDTPPNSTHFDSSKCLKLPKDENVNEGTTPISTLSAAPPKPMEYPYPPPPPWMYQYSLPSFPMPILPPYPYSAIPPTSATPALSNSASANSPMPSPRKALSLKVSLDLFCERYGIDIPSQQKLELLGYRPGDNNILKLDAEDWKEVKFTKLGWMSFLDAHRQFLRDVKSGQWDHLKPAFL